MRSLMMCPRLVLVGLVAILAGCAADKPAKPASYAFWPPAPDEPRIQFLTAFQSSTDVEPPKSALDSLIWGKEAVPVLPINKPYGAKFWNDKVYVCDIGNHCVSVLDLKQRVTRVLGVSGGDRLQVPADIAIGPEGIKYVADRGRGEIVMFDANDKPAGTFTRPEWKPAGVALWNDELAVADLQGRQIVVINRFSGQFVRNVGGPGVRDGQFATPVGVAYDAQGNLWATDMMRCRVQKFDRQGKYLFGFGAISDAVGAFARPKQMAIDSEGLLYVADSAFQNVQLFNDKGRCLTFFGAAGSHPGAMFLPVGVSVYEGDLGILKESVHPAFEAQRLVVVTNQMGTNKVALYALGRLKSGKSLRDLAGGRVNVTAGLVGGGGTAASRPSKLAPVPSSGRATTP